MHGNAKSSREWIAEVNVAPTECRCVQYTAQRRIDHAGNYHADAFTRAGGAEARHFGDIEALDAAVLAQLPRIASVLVKGSRFMKMERVADALAGTSGGHHAA